MQDGISTWSTWSAVTVLHVLSFMPHAIVKGAWERCALSLQDV